jgi:hypothetical protein
MPGHVSHPIFRWGVLFSFPSAWRSRVPDRYDSFTANSDPWPKWLLLVAVQTLRPERPALAAAWHRRRDKSLVNILSSYFPK